jgi:hypothetical protein
MIKKINADFEDAKVHFMKFGNSYSKKFHDEFEKIQMDLIKSFALMGKIIKKDGGSL